MTNNNLDSNTTEMKDTNERSLISDPLTATTVTTDSTLSNALQIHGSTDYENTTNTTTSSSINNYTASSTQIPLSQSVAITNTATSTNTTSATAVTSTVSIGDEEYSDLSFWRVPIAPLHF